MYIHVHIKPNPYTPVHTQSHPHARTHNNIRHTNNLPATQVPTKPHTQFEEVCKKLEILKEEIDEAEKRIEQWKSLNSSSQYLKNLKIYEEYLQRSRELYQEAIGYLISGNYTQAEQLIKEAHENVNKIPVSYPLSKPYWMSPGLGFVVFVVVLIIALLLLLLELRKRG